jgi:hypothetical protein
MQDNPAAVAMALSEPLGGGLFTSNVVLGAVVLLSSKSRKVRWEIPSFTEQPQRQHLKYLARVIGFRVELCQQQ